MVWVKKESGFTIVELLIVIVVIAILAAITIVAFNGVINNAKESSLKSDLRNGATQIQTAKAEQGSYPSDTSALKKSNDTTFQYSNTNTGFCLSATNNTLPGKTFHIKDGGAIEDGLCAGDVAIAGTMQDFTSAKCQALTTFTGTNGAALIGLTDSRGSIARTYTIGKLADGKCWMLTNLRLGSTMNTVTLTPSDSNVTSNFILPKLTNGTRSLDTSTNPGNDYDTPYAYSPVPGDTGSGGTNYGYLYNFSAATAGTTRVTFPAAAGDAVSSICPANWRLPTGGYGRGDWFQLNVAFGSGTDPENPNGVAAPKWQVDGAFRGVLSGTWYGGFSYQGEAGHFWSRSATEGTAGNAWDGGLFGGYGVDTANMFARGAGLAVRCIIS